MPKVAAKKTTKKKQPFRDAQAQALANTQNDADVQDDTHKKRKRLPAGTPAEQKKVKKSMSNRRLPALLKSIRSSQDDETIVNALLELNELIEAEMEAEDLQRLESYLNDILAKQGISRVLDLVDDRLDNASSEDDTLVLEEALRLLHSASMHEPTKLTIVEGVGSVLQVLETAKDANVIRHVCGILQNLAFENAYSKRLIRQHPGDAATLEGTLITLLRRHADDADLVWQALGLLGNLAELEASQDAIVALHGISVIAQLMRTHARNAPLQARACLVLGRLASGSWCKLVDQHDGTTQMLRALSQHGKDEGVRETASIALELVLLEGLTADDDAVVLETLTRLEGYINGSNVVRSVFRQGGGIGDVLSILETCRPTKKKKKTDPQVLWLAVTILFHFCHTIVYRKRFEHKRILLETKGSLEKIFGAVEHGDEHFCSIASKLLVRLGRQPPRERRASVRTATTKTWIKRVPEAPRILIGMLKQKTLDSVMVKNVCTLLTRFLREDYDATSQAILDCDGPVTLVGLFVRKNKPLHIKVLKRVLGFMVELLKEKRVKDLVADKIDEAAQHCRSKARKLLLEKTFQLIVESRGV